jgi:hypothetical protein
MPPLTPEEQAAMLRAFLGTGSGSNQINDLENLFAFSQNLLAQAAIGMPGVDAQYISDTVQQLAYTPYDGPDPLVIQEQVNEAMRRVASRLGIEPETVNSIAESIIDGIAPDVALAAISGLVFRDAEGNPRLDVSDAEKNEFDALPGILQAYQDAVEAERNTFVMDGQRYVPRDETAVRADMEELGLTGPFNDPNIWIFQPDQALAAAARETEAQAEQVGVGVADLRSQLEELERSTRVPVVTDRAMEQGIRDFALRDRTGGIQRQGRSDENVGAADVTDRPLGGIQRVGRSDANVGAAVGDLRPGGLYQRPDRAPSSRGTNAQLEADLKAAQRYATFAAADEARKQAAPEMANIRQQITEDSAEQNMLQAAAKMREQEAVERGSIPGAAQLDIYRDYLTKSFPTVTSGGGKQRYRLSQDQIRSVARAAAGPLRRGAQ